MGARFLITTADERSWRTDRPVLFLGEWCKLYDRRHVWSNLDAKVVPYHWDDRAQFYRDCLYLNDLYEKELELAGFPYFRISGFGDDRLINAISIVKRVIATD